MMGSGVRVPRRLQVRRSPVARRMLGPPRPSCRAASGWRSRCARPAAASPRSPRVPGRRGALTGHFGGSTLRDRAIGRGWPLRGPPSARPPWRVLSPALTPAGLWRSDRWSSPGWRSRAPAPPSGLLSVRRLPTAPSAARLSAAIVAATRSPEDRPLLRMIGSSGRCRRSASWGTRPDGNNFPRLVSRPQIGEYLGDGRNRSPWRRRHAGCGRRRA